jgi:CRISPR-associated protein Cas2
MWILVMFDLPVSTKEQARAASKFREFLLDEGYEMSQFSIYARFCTGKEQYETYVRHVENNLPDKGDVHILGFTDRQYETIIRFSGQTRKRQRKNPGQLVLF